MTCLLLTLWHDSIEDIDLVYELYQSFSIFCDYLRVVVAGYFDHGVKWVLLLEYLAILLGYQSHAVVVHELNGLEDV